MTAKIPICLLTALLLATICPAEAQQPVKLAKIGWLATRSSGQSAKRSNRYHEQFQFLRLNFSDRFS